MGTVDFKRHKDVVAHFNKEYVVIEIFLRELRRRLAEFKQLREMSDYDDFYVASKEKAEEQIKIAELVFGESKGIVGLMMVDYYKKGKILNNQNLPFFIYYTIFFPASSTEVTSRFGESSTRLATLWGEMLP